VIQPREIFGDKKLCKIRYFDNNRNMKSKTSTQNITCAPAVAPCSEPEALKALAALAQAQRLRVYRALVQAGGAGLTPGALAVMLDLPASSLSFHLKELVNAQLSHAEQQGRSLIYRADFSHMQALLGFLTENCCAADPAGGCC
jgi:ArsR family transcriptional regulator, arsenate/arsenite/antimonite-responsive transcriptional repressor